MMSSNNSLNSMKKRPHEKSGIQRSRKMPYGVVKVEDDINGEKKNLMFRILLPNGTILELKMHEARSEIPIDEFIDAVRKEYFTVIKQGSSEPKRRINWQYQDLHFTDAHANKMRIKANLCDFTPKKWHFLWLHDGSPEPDAYEDMWDLTPDTDLLRELPDDYTFETALADLIDNSLQALWSNAKCEIRLISVELHANKIVIFDSGPGMDGMDGNLVKWGKMGASLHRSMRGEAIGGNPPYLTPFFGMFGFGGPVATMCLGRRAVVSSKTKKCKKVFTLHLEREALMSGSPSENHWRTKGGTRDPSKGENENSPHRSFTKVEIFEPKMKSPNINHFRCKLKDIYFPYIQCDELSGKTSRPITFQVNGEDLVGIEGGEVAITNLHSCNGPNFILQLCFSACEDPSSMLGQRKSVLPEANARLKFVYFPIIEGVESIEKIIDNLDASDYGIRETFRSFSRVSIRRLGRLLPDARWASLPFMEPKQKKGEKAQILKRCSSRVKCFIDTDAGFNPTPHKTDLAHNHPYTKALKNFGNRASENEKEVQIEISRDGKKMTLPQLEKQYNDWISDMHDLYDEEVDGGLDKPTIVVTDSKIKKLNLSSNVVRVHKKILRRGMCWSSGQKIKILRGACPGVHKNNVFATLEYIILEGLPGEACGEARLICRPLGLPEDKGCQLLVEKGNNTVDIRESLVLPIRVIDCEKFLQVDDTEWAKKLEIHRQKLPSTIDLLSCINCQELEIEGGRPADVVKAGGAPPENIVAVIRPESFSSKNSSKRLDQKFIVKDNTEMTLEVKFMAGNKDDEDNIYSLRVKSSSHKGLDGFYLFPLKSKRPCLFQKAGLYKFSFCLTKFRDVRFEQVLEVEASTDVGSWKIVRPEQYTPYSVRVGSIFDPLYIACYDRYSNSALFTSVPKLTVKLSSCGIVLTEVCSMKVILTTDKSRMMIEGIVVRSSKLDDIRPNYEATLNISTLDEAFSVAFPCRVLPGTPQRITVHPSNLRKQLIPGQIIEELALEIFDEYGNHAKENESVILSVDGFSYQDRSGLSNDRVKCIKKVDATGIVDLGNVLKVSKGYDKDVYLSVTSNGKVILKMNFQTETRELRTMSRVFKNCEVGSLLENIVFEITDSEGIVDESVDHDEKLGQFHSLKIKSNTLDIDDSVRYSFRHGRCTIRSIPLPQTKGIFFFSAAHSHYPELALDIEVQVERERQEHKDDLGDHGDIGHPVLFPQISCEDSPEDSPINPHTPLKAVKQSHKIFSPQSSEKNVLPNCRSAKIPKFENIGSQNGNSDILPIQVSSSRDRGDLGGSTSISQKELEDDLAKCGMTMADHQNQLDVLHTRRSHVQQHISDLQDHNLHKGSSTYGKELILKIIKIKSKYASAVLSKLHEEVPSESRPQDVLGVVALLGTVQSIELGRMLGQYLGDNLMCAVVCKDYAAATSVERNTFHEFAAKNVKSTTGGYFALCLEDVRPSTLEPGSDPQAPLPLQMPTLPNGNIPQGFLGYAVNMVSIEENHSQWRTASGHGLRETLFYRLFGNLQVYETRLRMMQAESCVKDGAISLDGGIMKGNGLLSFGNWESSISFPVLNKAFNLRNFKTLQAKILELTEIDQHIDEAKRSYERAREKFLISRDRYNSYGPSSGRISHDNNGWLC